jgi:hypothetical protein
MLIDLELLTMQAYIDRDNLEQVEKIESKELLLRQIQIMHNVEFDRKMRDFKLRRKIWRKSVLNLFMKIRHLNKCANLTNCSHQMFDLSVLIINRAVSFSCRKISKT